MFHVLKDSLKDQYFRVNRSNQLSISSSLVRIETYSPNLRTGYINVLLKTFEALVFQSNDNAP